MDSDLCQMSSTFNSVQEIEKDDLNTSESEYNLSESSLSSVSDTEQPNKAKRHRKKPSNNKKADDDSNKRQRRIKRSRTQTQRFGNNSPEKYDQMIKELENNSLVRPTEEVNAKLISNDCSNSENSTGDGSSSTTNSMNELITSAFKSIENKIISIVDARISAYERKLLEDFKLQFLRLEAKVNLRRTQTTRKVSRLLSIDALPESTVDELGFPLNSPDEVEKFEISLKEDDFKKRVYNGLIILNGDNGELEAGKLIKSLFYTIFTKENPFTRILGLIFDLLKAADNQYTRNEFERDVVHKVFKYAFQGRTKKNVNAVTISGTANHQQNIELSSSQSNTAQLITVPVRSLTILLMWARISIQIICLVHFTTPHQVMLSATRIIFPIINLQHCSSNSVR